MKSKDVLDVIEKLKVSEKPVNKTWLMKYLQEVSDAMKSSEDIIVEMENISKNYDDKILELEKENEVYKEKIRITADNLSKTISDLAKK